MAGSDGERSFSTILRENKDEQYYHRLQRHFTKLRLETTTRTSKKNTFSERNNHFLRVSGG